MASKGKISGSKFNKMYIFIILPLSGTLSFCLFLFRIQHNLDTTTFKIFNVEA